MLLTTELDMAHTVALSDISDFLIDSTWAVRSTYHTVLKPDQVQLFWAGICCLTSPFWLTRTKLPIIGNTKPITTPTVKTSLEWIEIIKLGIKYYFVKKVSSKNQKVSTIMILGLYQQSI